METQMADEVQRDRTTSILQARTFITDSFILAGKNQTPQQIRELEEFLEKSVDEDNDPEVMAETYMTDNSLDFQWENDPRRIVIKDD